MTSFTETKPLSLVTDQAANTALSQLLEYRRLEIDEGAVIPADEVFAEIEAMDRRVTSSGPAAR